MIFVTAMIIGIAAGLQRSAIGSILGAALVSIAFMAAVAASAVPPPLMTLFVQCDLNRITVHLDGRTAERVPAKQIEMPSTGDQP